MMPSTWPPASCTPRVVPPPTQSGFVYAAQLRAEGRGRRWSAPSAGQGEVLAEVERLYADAEETASLLAAVDTLYADGLKPYGRILRKRLGERVEARLCAPTPLSFDTSRLRVRCEACAWLQVVDDEGGEWSATLKGREHAFVDVYSPVDVYEPELWLAFAQYFESQAPEALLPGGRYACAQALVARNLHFLQGRSLGQICHIVQLAISQKKLLGYLSGSVVPYARSQSMVKDQCALLRQVPGAAVGSASALERNLATWDMARDCLQELLRDAAADGTVNVPLSNIKVLFQARCGAELCETALGHPKLSELLQDSRMSDVCAIRLQGHGYVVTPPRQPQMHCEVHPSPSSSGKRLVATPPAVPVVEPNAGGLTTQNTFIHVRSASEGARRRVQSVPKSLGSTRDNFETECHAFRYRHEPVGKATCECDTASETELSTLASSGCSLEFFSSAGSDASGETASDVHPEATVSC